MTKLKLRIKTATTEVEYDGEDSLLNSEMSKLLEIITKSDNAQSKATILEAFDGLQQCMDELVGINQSFSVHLAELQKFNQSFNLQHLGLQQQMQNENRMFTMVSNVMKNKHDTAKNAISNLR